MDGFGGHAPNVGLIEVESTINEHNIIINLIMGFS